MHNFAAAPKDERRAGAAVTISRLNGLTLDAKYRRDANIASVAAETDFAQHYDFRTLFYDAFHVSHKRAVCLICPPLLNFKPSVQRARFRDAGGALRGPAIHSHKRFSEVWLSHASGSGRLNLGFDGEPLSAQISPDENQSFANLNCAVIKSKNNDLQWIYDWADYYVKVHNLQGLVFFDNCSDKYDLPDIAATLAKVAGLRRAVVVSAPYTFGVYAFNDTLFLQVALLNIARLRFLARARAVLCVDLDELVAPMSEGSVFDATVATLLGYLLFEGRWREAAPDAASPARHRDHIFETDAAHIRNTKYCICPGKLAGASHWDIHGAIRGEIKKLFVDPRANYWHCRQISTSWGPHRPNLANASTLKRDQTLAELFETVFASAPLAPPTAYEPRPGATPELDPRD